MFEKMLNDKFVNNSVSIDYQRSENFKSSPNVRCTIKPIIAYYFNISEIKPKKGC